MLEHSPFTSLLEIIMSDVSVRKVDEQRQRGFTLIELLVAIGIIGVLMSLLLPAVQRARAASRSMQCKNNIKQQALAVHNYHDVYQSVPTILFCLNDRCDSWSWGALILPQLEQANLHSQFDLSFFPTDPQNAVHLDEPLPVFRCPSEIAPQSITFYEFCSLQEVTMYVANSVMNWHLYTAQVPPGNLIREHLTWRDITDGQTSTLLVGEKNYDTSDNYSKELNDSVFGFTWADNHNPLAFCAGFNDSIDSCTDLPYSTIAYQGITGPRNIENYLGLASYHEGGVNVALCDGSVRFISQNIDSTTLRWLAWPDDAQIVGEF